MGALVFILPDGARREVAYNDGDSVMEAARRAGLDIEGTCEGAMACSTCHVVVDDAWAARLPPAGVEEEAQLDCTTGVTRRSRLGCQIKLDETLNGLTVRLP
jgi:2Fe-2S ferredoxin